MGRLPRKDQLLRRNLSHINDDLNCPLFGEEKVLGSVEQMLWSSQSQHCFNNLSWKNNSSNMQWWI